MYICHVSDVHLPNFLIVESLYRMILSAMAPPARRECAPIKSGSIPLSCRLSDFVAVRTALTISWLSTECHLLLMHTSQMRFLPFPPLEMMWCTLLATAATAPPGPVDSWCSVCPVRPFFWLEILIVHESAVSKMWSGESLGRIFPSFQNPISCIWNCLVLVACTIFPFRLILRGFVYSPLRSR